MSELFGFGARDARLGKMISFCSVSQNMSTLGLTYLSSAYVAKTKAKVGLGDLPHELRLRLQIRRIGLGSLVAMIPSCALLFLPFLPFGIGERD